MKEHLSSSTFWSRCLDHNQKTLRNPFHEIWIKWNARISPREPKTSCSQNRLSVPKKKTQTAKLIKTRFSGLTTQTKQMYSLANSLIAPKINTRVNCSVHYWVHTWKNKNSVLAAILPSDSVIWWLALKVSMSHAQRVQLNALLYSAAFYLFYSTKQLLQMLSHWAEIWGLAGW